MPYHQLPVLQGLSSHASNEREVAAVAELTRSTCSAQERQQIAERFNNSPALLSLFDGYSMAYLWDMVIKSYAETSRG